MMSLHRNSRNWPTRCAAVAVLLSGMMLLTGKPVLAQDASDPMAYNMEIDVAMGVLDVDPVLDRILTTQPRPWPGPRYDPRSEGIIKRDAEQAQDDFRALIPQNNLVCTQVGKPGGRFIIVCQ